MLIELKPVKIVEVDLNKAKKDYILSLLEELSKFIELNDIQDEKLSNLSKKINRIKYSISI